MPVPERLRYYLIAALAGTPEVVAGLLDGVPAGSTLWDARPDPDRFSLREVLAHLAEYDAVTTERIVRTRDEENPALPNWDEEQAVIANDYAHADPHATLARLRQSRAALADLIREMPTEAWERTCQREGVGPMTMVEVVTYFVAHDGYHTHQIARYASLS